MTDSDNQKFNRRATAIFKKPRRGRWKPRERQNGTDNVKLILYPKLRLTGRDTAEDRPESVPVDGTYESEGQADHAGGAGDPVEGRNGFGNIETRPSPKLRLTELESSQARFTGLSLKTYSKTPNAGFFGIGGFLFYARELVYFAGYYRAG